MTNVMIAGACIVVIISNPEILREVDVTKVAWILSGIIMLIAFILQVAIFFKIYQRSKDPANYHTNYIGKKVLHSTVISKLDMMIFFGAMPFLLIAGAYFIAKLINYLR
jgi:predicted secreted protein